MRRKLYFAPVAGAIALHLGRLLAQDPPNNAVYFLKDAVRRQWCGYSDESRFKGQIQELKALVVGEVDYSKGHVSRVHITESDETGDWAVNDEYMLDGSDQIQTLKRTTNILPEDMKIEQFYVMAKGKAIGRSSTYRELRSGLPTQRRVDWFMPPPIITRVQAFPFSALINRNQQALGSTGEVCVPDPSN